MSGFERSAPIPGSQGPRRSQMKRINNAPPPLTPWRAEVLEAQRQMEALKKGRSHSGSRSRSRPEQNRERGGGGGVASGAASTSSKAKEVVAQEAGLVLRQARERGEGWYAAVARAAESWKQDVGSARRAAQQQQQPKGAGKEEVGAKGKEQRDKKRKDRPEEGNGERLDKKDEPRRDRKEDIYERERIERQAREEYEARAEERARKAEEERRRAEEERHRKEQLQRERQAKLKGAFAVDDDDQDEEEVRQAVRARKLADRTKKRVEVTDAVAQPANPSGSASPDKSSASGAVPVDPDLSSKLRFEPGLDPAEAFMRLQERKRKGRRAEFGGPPRGCSPWRDGRRGISWQKKEDENE